jgi:ubiquinone/menaquinone biosynthesis C-methylase UbiE
MGWYQRYILPRLIDITMSSRDLAPYRTRTIAAARGRVLEIGVGSGINLPLYGAEVIEIVAIDPSPELLALARKHAGSRATLMPASAEALPFADASFDTVVTTWTLCSIPSAAKALREVHRVLRPDGRLLFAEHGLAPTQGMARWQHRLTPCWRCLAGGCHLDRKIDELIAAAGFRLDHLETGYLRARTPFSYMYQGAAHPNGV